MVAENNGPKIVKAVPSSPIYAVFDLVEIEGKQVIVGQVTFRDQFGLDRTAKTGTEKGVLNLGVHILAILNGQVDITEPNEEDKKRLAENLLAEAAQAKQEVQNVYSKENADEPKP